MFVSVTESCRALKCPNCGANLNFILNHAGTVKCEYCGGYIEIGAIECQEETLYADNKPIVNINSAIKGTFMSASEAAMALEKKCVHVAVL